MKKLITIVLIMLSFNVMADEYHHHNKNIINNNNSTINNYTNDYSAIAAAMGMHQFDQSTFVWQKSISIVTVEDNKAVSFAFAIRKCYDCGLLSIVGAAGESNNSDKISTGIGAAYTWSY